MKRPGRFLIALGTAMCLAVAVSNARAQAPGGEVVRQVLTLEDAVRLALERNISISIASSHVDNAGARVASAFGTFLPEITVNGGYSRPLTNGNVYVQGIPVPGASERPSVLQANAQASLLLFDGFSRTATYSSAQSNFNASVEDLNRERQNTTHQARTTFLNALRAEQLIEVRQNDLDLARENLARIRGMVEAGVAQEGQVFSEEANIANAELALEQARTDAIVAHQALAYVINVDPRSELQLSSDGLGSSLDSSDVAQLRTSLGSEAELFERQHRNRPDLQSARLRVDAADAAITTARAGYFPSVAASIGYQWQKADQTTSNDASLGLNFQFTPFDGFRTSEQVQIARAQKLTAELELRRAELQASADLQQALARLEGAQRQITAADRAVAAARQNRFAADQRYKAGVGSYADFLLANSQYLAAQINQVNAVYNYRLAIFDVRYHVGE